MATIVAAIHCFARDAGPVRPDARLRTHSTGIPCF